jgi:signal transduction histidine kinase/CheY-like chemotaxis protein
MSMSEERPASDLRRTPYQLTLSALIVPWPLHALLNAVTGVAFGLVAGPALGILWVACLTLGDAILQRQYARLNARAALVDSDRGLRRLAWVGSVKGVLWISAPTAFAVMTRNPGGLAFVAVTAILLTALAVSTFRNSRLMFLSVACVPIAALAACIVAVFGASAIAGGLLIGLVIVVLMLLRIATGTNRTVAAWNQASQQAAEALASMKAALERSTVVERRLRIAVEIADLYVFEADYQTQTFTSSGAEQELFDELYGGEDFWKDAFRSVFAEDLAGVKAAWASYVAGEGPYRLEHRAHGPNGRLIWVSAFAELVRDDSGRPLVLIGALRNITDRKRSELELTKALEDAEAGSRVKGEFLTVMSHEIRTPLNGVLGMIQAIERDELAPAQRLRLEVARESGETLLLLLNSLLDLSKLATGDLEFEVGEIDIALVAETALKAFASAAADKGLSLALNLSPEARGVYAGDRGRVEQLLYHLISNAVKFTDAGSVSVTVARRDGALTIQVADTGIGISADQAQRLFANFAQVDASLTRRHGGSGLGLALCRKVAVKMGGMLDVQSSLGSGSTFTATLPLPRLRDVGDRAPGVSGEEDAAEQAPLRVLVAEDNLVNQLVLKTLLQQAGIEPMVVGDGEQALTAWRDADWDVILMDVQMPVMDGVTASRAIRDEEAASDRTRTPIVAVTANVMAHQVQAYRTAGIDDVVAKPVQVARLMDAIEGALSPQAPSMPLNSAAA